MFKQERPKCRPVKFKVDVDLLVPFNFLTGTVKFFHLPLGNKHFRLKSILY